MTSRVTAPAGRQTVTSGAKAMMRIHKVQSEQNIKERFKRSDKTMDESGK